MGSYSHEHHLDDVSYFSVEHAVHGKRQPAEDLVTPNIKFLDSRQPTRENRSSESLRVVETLNPNE